MDPTILEGNLELCSKDYKRLPALWSSHTTAGFVPQRDKEKDSYKNIYSLAFCGGKKLENEGVSLNWGMDEQIVVSVGDGILLCSKE